MIQKRAVLLSILTIAAYLALFYAVPRIPLAPGTGVLAGIIVTTVAFIGLQVAIVRWAAEIRITSRTAVLALLVSVALFVIGFVLIASSQHERLLQLVKDPRMLAELQSLKPGFASYSFLYTTYRGPLVPVMTLLVIASATLLGYTVSFLLRERNLVLPVAIFAAFVDIWTVSVGPTAMVTKSAPEIVQAVSAQIPIPGAGRIAPISFVGPGDFLFLAILFGAICRLGMNARRTYWFVFPLLALGMLVVILGDALLLFLLQAGAPAWLMAPLQAITSRGLPALVLVGLGVVVANYREFKLNRSELKAIGVVAAVVAVAAFILTPILTGRP